MEVLLMMIDGNVWLSVLHDVNRYFQLLPAHPWIRRPLPAILRVLAWLGVVPEDVPRVAELMNEGGDGLSGLGKLNAITPQYYVLAIKPE